MRARVGPFALTLTLVVLAVSGCGEKERATFDATSKPAGPERVSEGDALSGRGSGEALAAQDQASGARLSSTGGGGGTQVDRSIIRTAILQLTTKDVVKASREVSRIAEDVGGSVASSRAELEGRASAEVVVRVPPESYRSVLEDLREIGKVRGLTESARDVTDQVVDLEGRLAAARASADRLRALIGQAENVTAIASVEAELTKRESEIESFEGRLRVLEAQVEQATITVRIDEPDAPALRNEDGPSFIDGLRTGWDAAIASGNLILAVTGFLLPFLPPIALLVLALRWWIRRRRQAVRRLVAERGDRSTS